MRLLSGFFLYLVITQIGYAADTPMYLNQIPQTYTLVGGKIEYFGAPGVPTGIVGKSVKVCTVVSQNCPQYNAWGAEYYVPGGLVRAVISYPITNIDSSSNCYFRPMWSLKAGSRPESFMTSSSVAQMSQTVSNNYWDKSASVMVGDYVRINKPCSDLDRGTVVDLPISGANLYLNVTDTASGNPTWIYPAGATTTDARAVNVGINGSISFVYGVIVCSTTSVSASLCTTIYRPFEIDINSPGTDVPIPPVECNLMGLTSIDLGVIGKDGQGEKGTIYPSIQCNSDASMTFTIIDGTLDLNGVVVGLSFVDNNDTKLTISVVNTVSIPISAEIKSIAQGIELGERYGSTILLTNIN
ncbi:hypothetical protein [Providencia stuartii]|uniref:hypothetical protein n=1 Tax=Providencia stuartii TaxID=588 RepID=UPI001122908D|nr:hypothetical protein [Providencia stuartii]